MKPPLPIPIRLAPALAVCLAAGLASGGAAAEIIDRIAVSVGTQVITTSDIDREVRVTAFLNGVPADLSPAARKAAAERMVEQRLVLKELQNNRYPEPMASEVEPGLEAFKKKYYPSAADYDRELARRGIGEQEVRDLLLWQRRLLLFLDIRFKPGVTINAQEIQNYFAKESPGKSMGPEDRERIEAKLADESANRQMDTWLQNAKRRSEIVFHPEAFQ